jgi:hypothetical protein
VKIEAGDFRATFAGQVSVGGGESAGLSVDIGLEDRFWTALEANASLTFALEDGSARGEVPLKGVRAPLRLFRSNCMSILEEADKAATPDIAGPFTYECEDGSSFAASYSNSILIHTAKLVIKGRDMTLPQMAASVPPPPKSYTLLFSVFGCSVGVSWLKVVFYSALNAFELRRAVKPECRSRSMS